MNKMSMEEKLPYAAFFELMALSFKYPTREFMDLIYSGEYKDAYVEVAGLVGLDEATIDDMVSTLDAMVERDREELFHEMRTEYTRLFVGTPRPAVSYSEGVWRGYKRGDSVVLAVINNTTIAVEKFMKSCGVFASKTNRDPIDNIYTECEFMQYLLTKSAFPEDFAYKTPDEAFSAFLKEHMAQWIPGFAEQVQENTELAWLGALVRTMAAYVGLLADMEGEEEQSSSDEASE